MPVSFGFARWSYGGDTVNAGKATVIPRDKPALFRSPVRPGYLKKVKPLPGERRFSTVYPDSMRCAIQTFSKKHRVVTCIHLCSCNIYYVKHVLFYTLLLFDMFDF